MIHGMKIMAAPQNSSIQASQDRKHILAKAKALVLAFAFVLAWRTAARRQS